MNLALPADVERAIEVFFTPANIAANEIQQHEWEVRTFLRLALDELKPERTVELGTYKGMMAALLSLISRQTVSVDIEPWDTTSICNMEANLSMIVADASEQWTVNTVMQRFGNNPLDLLFIDDGHYYETIVKEFALWGPMVRPGGWIAFHDINPLANIGPHGTQPDCIQVPRFWRELTGHKQEIVATAESGYRGHLPHGGIGILRV